MLPDELVKFRINFHIHVSELLSQHIRWDASESVVGDGFTHLRLECVQGLSCRSCDLDPLCSVEVLVIGLDWRDICTLIPLGIFVVVETLYTHARLMNEQGSNPYRGNLRVRALADFLLPDVAHKFICRLDPHILCPDHKYISLTYSTFLIKVSASTFPESNSLNTL